MLGKWSRYATIHTFQGKVDHAGRVHWGGKIRLKTCQKLIFTWTQKEDRKRGRKRVVVAEKIVAVELGTLFFCFRPSFFLQVTLDVIVTLLFVRSAVFQSCIDSLGLKSERTIKKMKEKRRRHTRRERLSRLRPQLVLAHWMKPLYGVDRILYKYVGCGLPAKMNAWRQSSCPTNLYFRVYLTHVKLLKRVWQVIFS